MNHPLLCIPAGDRKAFHPLFQNASGTIARACLEGCMGSLYADSMEHPHCAAAIAGDFVYLAGDASHPAAAQLVQRLQGMHRALAIPLSEGWKRLLDAATIPFQPFQRHAFSHDTGGFNRARLTAYTQNLPAGCNLRRMDAAAYRLAMQEDWSRDLCVNFAGEEDFLQNGLGFCIWKDGRLASGAASYTWFSGGYEIEVDTRGDCRRRRLATACAAAFILHCLDSGKLPGWDAANPESAALAVQLGYRPDGVYTAYQLL